MTTKLTFKYTIIFLLLGFILVPKATMADGNELLKQCIAGLKVLNNVKNLSKIEYMDAAFCAGLVQGITDSYRIYRLSKTIPSSCLPGKVINKSQATRIVVKYLREHPERLHLHESNLVIDALSEAFPCPGK
ncbi:Rap1a/Tai family immunity protein [Thermodesulfobacteriota bacterium]